MNHHFFRLNERGGEPLRREKFALEGRGPDRGRGGGALLPVCSFFSPLSSLRELFSRLGAERP